MLRGLGGSCLNPKGWVGNSSVFGCEFVSIAEGDGDRGGWWVVKGTVSGLV